MTTFRETNSSNHRSAQIASRFLSSRNVSLKGNERYVESSPPESATANSGCCRWRCELRVCHTHQTLWANQVPKNAQIPTKPEMETLKADASENGEALVGKGLRSALRSTFRFPTPLPDPNFPILSSSPRIWPSRRSTSWLSGLLRPL